MNIDPPTSMLCRTKVLKERKAQKLYWEATRRGATTPGPQPADIFKRIKCL